MLVSAALATSFNVHAMDTGAGESNAGPSRRATASVPLKDKIKGHFLDELPGNDFCEEDEPRQLVQGELPGSTAIHTFEVPQFFLEPFFGILVESFIDTSGEKTTYGLKPDELARLERMVVNFTGADAEDHYQIFRYFVNLSGEQLAALDGMIEENPDLLSALRTITPNLSDYTPELIGNPLMIQKLTTPLEAYNATEISVKGEPSKIQMTVYPLSSDYYDITVTMGNQNTDHEFLQTLANKIGCSPDDFRIGTAGGIGSRIREIRFSDVPTDRLYDVRRWTTAHGCGYVMGHLYLEKEAQSPEGFITLSDRDDATDYYYETVSGHETLETLTVKASSVSLGRLFLKAIKAQSMNYPLLKTIYLCGNYERLKKEILPKELALTKTTFAASGFPAWVTLVVRDEDSGKAIAKF